MRREGARLTRGTRVATMGVATGAGEPATMPPMSAVPRRAVLTNPLAGGSVAEPVAPRDRLPPVAGSTVRLAQRSMACEFACALNPGDRSRVVHAGDALAVVHELEGQLSIYRPDSAVSRLNAAGAEEEVEPGLFGLLERAGALAALTGGAFTPVAGRLVRLWREARASGTLPDEARAADAARSCDAANLVLDPATRGVRLERGAEIDLGGIGKGYALDRAAERLAEQGVSGFLLHGGRSSVLARGDHAGPDGEPLGGWPIGLGDPHRTTRRLGTVLLTDRAMATSGSNVQFFRHGGRRYGHLLDPRTGRSVDPDRPGGLIGATAFADSAADADALSTAFYVLGHERATAFLDANPRFGGILVAPPVGPRLPVTVRNLDPASLFLDPAVAVTPD